jgi:hypothetical protein
LFADTEEIAKTSGRILVLRTEISTQNLTNTKQEFCPLDRDVIVEM